MDRLHMENKHLYVEKKGREVVVVVSLLKTNKKAYSSLNSRIQNRKKKQEKKVRKPIDSQYGALFWVRETFLNLTAVMEKLAISDKN